MRRAAVKGAWLCVAIVIGPTSGIRAQPGTGPEAEVEVTADGLHRVDPSVMRSAWAKPDLDLKSYTKILPWRAAISFRSAEDEGSQTRRRGPKTYPISADRQLQIRTLFGEAFQAELAALENFELWSGPGRDVLMVEGYLLDVTSHIPLEQAIVDDIAADITWEATLVVQVRDSMTDEILARAAERYRERGGFGSGAGNWIHTQQVIRQWSRILCDRLDELADIGYLP
jgi:hypothetical protein